MENVLVAIFVIFLLLFGALALTNAALSAQQTVQTAQEDMNSRADEIDHTALAPVGLRIGNPGNVIEVTVRNSGSVKLADFSHWDVFTESYDGSATPAYSLEKLQYSDTEAGIGQWSVAGIYADAQAQVEESYDPGVLNPGEELTLHLDVSPAVGMGQSARVTIATDMGVTTSLIGTRNVPPTLPVYSELKVASGGSEPITPDELLAQDIDNTASELTYTVMTPPAQGTLTAGSTTSATTFTQQQIDDGKVFYTHIGTDPDSFNFTLSDGIDTIGPFPFTIAINKPPILDPIATLTLQFPVDPGATSKITTALLNVTDEDDSNEKLIYTITQFPANGSLSLGSTFSQDDINHNLLTYTHTGIGGDQFKFLVSDGYDVIGPYTFVLTPAS